MSKYAIDFGHGVGQDRGAYNILSEEDIINAVGSLVVSLLRGRGHEVIEVRPTSASSVSDSLIKRVNKADANNVDLFVSIHANAGCGVGSEVFTYRAEEVPEARNVLNNLVALGFTDRGIKGNNLYVVNQTKATAMLIEICFTDTQSDVDLYNKLGAEAIANAIVNGITGEEVANHVTPMYTEPSAASTIIDSWVGKLQAECNEQGFSNQVVDGIPGPNTLAGCPLLKYGAQGNITKLLQSKLVALGYNTNGIDGDFGNGTRNAVVQFQLGKGLVSDGIVGANTWARLLSL